MYIYNCRCVYAACAQTLAYTHAHHICTRNDPHTPRRFRDELSVPKSACVRTNIYTFWYMYIYMYICMYIHTYMYVYVHCIPVNIYVYIHTYHVRISIESCVYNCRSVYIYEFVHTCASVCKSVVHFPKTPCILSICMFQYMHTYYIFVSIERCVCMNFHTRVCVYMSLCADICKRTYSYTFRSCH